jgi:hypothetical protein
VRRGGGLFAAGLSLATAVSAGSAKAAPPRRVIVAGPQDDTIAARVQKELTALGLETIRVDGLDSCARSAVVVAAQNASAIAATCSDGDQVGVWVAENGTLRLRDVVFFRDEGEPGRETTAVRAAEVTRATIAMHEAEEEARTNTPPPAPPPAPLPPPPSSSDWDSFDRPPPKPAALTPPRRAPAFLAGAGVSSLIGVDAGVPAFSGQAEIGIFRNFTATARLEYPLSTSEVGSEPSLRVAPAFAGGGIGIPLRTPDTFIIPRLGAGILAFDRIGNQVTTTGGSDSTASFAAYASAGLSMRIFGPLRFTVDGVFGSTTSRLVVRDRGVHMAYWGAPFGTLALRMELMIQ